MNSSSLKRFTLISMMVVTIIPISATAVRSEPGPPGQASDLIYKPNDDTSRKPATVDTKGGDNSNDANNKIGGKKDKEAEEHSTDTPKEPDQPSDQDNTSNNAPASRQGPVFLNLELIHIIGILATIALLLSIFAVYELFQIDNEIKTLKRESAKKKANNAFDQEPKYTALEQAKIIKLENDISRLRTLEKDLSNIKTDLAKQKQIQSSNITQNIRSKSPSRTDQVNPNLKVGSIPQKPSIQEQIEKLMFTANSVDSHKLRDAAKAELNVTDESSNSIQMGISKSISLEEVNVSGSYLLFEIEGNYYLFPTSSTLRVYNSSQTLKSLFEYETRVISRPEIIQPAMVEKSGSTWQLLSKGKLGTP